MAAIATRYKTATSLEVTVTNDEGEPEDITGWVFFFTAKRDYMLKVEDPEDDLAVVKVDVTEHADPAEGKTVIELPGDVTVLGELWYDVVAYDNTEAHNMYYSPVEPLRIGLVATQRRPVWT